MCDVVFDLGETWRCLLFAFSILRTPRLCVAPAKRALRACGCARNAPIHASAYCALRAHYADAWCPQTEEKQTKTSKTQRDTPEGTLAHFEPLCTYCSWRSLGGASELAGRCSSLGRIPHGITHRSFERKPRTAEKTAYAFLTRRH